VGGHGFGTRTFWTVAIPDRDVTVQFGAGRAEMNVQNLSLDDFLTKPIGLGPNWQTASAPAEVSFDVLWSGPITRHVSVTNGTLGDQYAGDYVENQVTVTWSGTNLATGFSFTANPGTLATSAFDGGFAELGHEQNGIFFGTDSTAALQAPTVVSPARDQAFAALALPGGSLEGLPASAASMPGAALSSVVQQTGLKDALAGNVTAHKAAAVSTALESALDFLANPAAAAPFVLTGA
jgi:hypothetical protein